MFIGNIANPIADARLGAGYSCQRLAKKLDVSKQYISRAEHGTYRTLNSDLVKWVATEKDIHADRVMQLYRNFQVAVRSKTILDMNPTELTRAGYELPGNEIFTLWRSCYWPSVVAFSNAFCIHPEVVRAYEDGAREEMPSELKDILTRCNILHADWTESSIGNDYVKAIAAP